MKNHRTSIKKINIDELFKDFSNSKNTSRISENDNLYDELYIEYQED